MALSIDKEVILEHVFKHKDPLFVLVLLIVLLGGGWFLYQQSAQSVDDIISEVMSSENSGRGGSGEKIVATEDVVSKLLEKQDLGLFNQRRNPFGSPEEQLRMRQEVESAFQKGKEFFNAGQYDAAIQQFDKVITLDVTETRIPYEIQPSEYRRRALLEKAKKDLDRILQTAQTDIAEGDRLAQEEKPQQALSIYARASNNLSQLIESDQDGTAIGKENLDRLDQLRKQADNKQIDLRRKVLLKNYSEGIKQAQQSFSGNDLIALLRSLNVLIRVNEEIVAVDPNSQLIKRNQRTQLNTIYDQISTKLVENYPILISQAEQQFNQSLEARDTQQAQVAIIALRQAMNFNPPNQETIKKQDLNKKINDFVLRRAQLVIDICQQFATEQDNLLKQGQYNQFDKQGKIRHLSELLALKDIGVSLTPTLRDRIGDVDKLLRALRLPPPVTDVYEITSITSGTRGYLIQMIDKKSRTRSKRPIRVTLKEGQEDPRTKITLKQVDTTNGFVILSKLGYSDAKVSIKPSN